MYATQHLFCTVCTSKNKQANKKTLLKASDEEWQTLAIEVQGI